MRSAVHASRQAQRALRTSLKPAQTTCGVSVWLPDPEAPGGSRTYVTNHSKPAQRTSPPPTSNAWRNSRSCSAGESLGQLARRRYATSTEEVPIWCTATEESQAKLIEVARQKNSEHVRLTHQDAITASIQERKMRARFLKQYGPLAAAWSEYQRLRKAILDLLPHLEENDQQLREMFQVEHEELCAELDRLVNENFRRVLIPLPTASEYPAIVTMSAAAGGAEACLFLEELARAYTRFAESHGWSVLVMSSSAGSTGGLRERTMRIDPSKWDKGSDEQKDGVYGHFVWERGVHRVQRVPQTEGSGRVHTSTVGVIVLPVYPDTPEDALFEQSDVKEETMRAGGKGGQHVNKTESAIRLTHIPTGITVSMQDSRSQHQNREWAYDVLRSRLAEKRDEDERAERKANRKSQVASGDRSEKVRTYNFPQDRATDHRVGFTMVGLGKIMEGDGLGQVMAALQHDFADRRLQGLLEGEDDLEY